MYESSVQLPSSAFVAQLSPSTTGCCLKNNVQQKSALDISNRIRQVNTVSMMPEDELNELNVPSPYGIWQVDMINDDKASQLNSQIYSG